MPGTPARGGPARFPLAPGAAALASPLPDRGGVRHPALPPAIALIAGVACGAWLPGRWEAGAAALALAWAVAMAAWSQRGAGVCLVSSLAAFWAGGWAVAAIDTDAALHPPLRAALIDARGPDALEESRDDPVGVEGRLVADAAPSPSGVSLRVDVRGLQVEGRRLPASGGVAITVAGDVPAHDLESWRAGRVLLLPSLLRRPTRYLDPGVADNELALARRGVSLVGMTKSALLVSVAERGHPLAEAAAETRRIARARLDAAVGRWDPRSAAIVRAILIGDRAGLDDRVERLLQEAGTYHVLAISGGNVAILAAVIIVSLRGIGAGRRLAEGATAVLLVAYAYLVGGGPSVERATLMAVTYLVAHAVDHRSRPANSLALAAGAGLAVSPLSLFDPALWLTYGATLAILVGVPRLASVVSGRPRVLRQAWLLFAASLAAETALFPVGAFVFSRVTIAGLVLNFLAIPLMTVVQVAGLAALGLSFVAPVAAAAAGRVAHAAAWALVESAGLVRVAPWLSYRLAPPSMAVMAVYYAGWIGVLTSAEPLALAWRTSRRARRAYATAAVAVAASGAWILAAPSMPEVPRGWMRVTFLDVGQGDAILLQVPSGHALLVDAGGAGGSAFDIGQRVIEPVLWARRVRRLEYLVLTHGDADHVNGAAPVLRDFRPREVWEGVPVPRLAALQDLRSAMADRRGGWRGGWRGVVRGDTLRLGPVVLRAWHPVVPDWERQRVRNDDSMVLEVLFGDVSVVLAGDVGAAVEPDLAALIPPAPIRVLKVPHHGSPTSSTPGFVTALGASAVVVSVGRGNRFGHPAQIILDRYRRAGAAVFRTDEHGAVTLDTDGQTAALTTFTGRRLRLDRRR